jgi:pyrroline-5-carboxylate reductase
MLLATQTMLGTAKLLMEKELEPQTLIDMVTSPKGTTAAGREILEHSDISRIMSDTIAAAVQRSIELGQ